MPKLIVSRRRNSLVESEEVEWTKKILTEMYLTSCHKYSSGVVEVRVTSRLDSIDIDVVQSEWAYEHHRVLHLIFQLYPKAGDLKSLYRFYIVRKSSRWKPRECWRLSVYRNPTWCDTSRFALNKKATINHRILKMVLSTVHNISIMLQFIL